MFRLKPVIIITSLLNAFVTTVPVAGTTAVVAFGIMLGAVPGFVAPLHAEDVDPLYLLKKKCKNRRGVRLLISPQVPVAGKPMRVLVVSEREVAGATLIGKGPGGLLELKALKRGGPPYFSFAVVEKPIPGRYRFALLDSEDTVVACGGGRVKRRHRPDEVTDYWPIKRAWSRTMENVYSAWVEMLFDSPEGTRPSWTPLHQVIRDPKRNILYNHLGYDEDGPNEKVAVVLKPDCADLPYFLRAYFSWKLRLPFGYRHCNRGSATQPTQCRELKTNVGMVTVETPSRKLAAKTFSQFLRRKVSYVHSASGRTAPDDEDSDLYPVKLDRNSLRPGTVYVDPFGHLLIISRWHDQTETKSGLLYAIDGHPDLSVGRKRFWRGAFMFKSDIRGGAGGFKAFRPLVRRDDQVVPLTNEEIHKSGNYGNYSTGQYKLGLQGFYDRMDSVINARPLSPTHAYRERMKALFELLQERIDSVAAGEKHMKENNYTVVDMPNGPRIFQTQGAWEDFSTPARDMRLLIAIEDVMHYPERVIKFPKRFALAEGQTPEQGKAAMEKLFTTFSAENTISYLNSEGAKVTLTMADVIARRKGLEVAYNPNDCVEIRWGGTEQEMKTCKRRANAEQRARMAKYRRWFASRTRPPIR